MENAKKKRPVNSINCTKMPEKAVFTIMDYSVEAIAQTAVALAYLMFFKWFKKKNSEWHDSFFGVFALEMGFEKTFDCIFTFCHLLIKNHSLIF